MNRIPTKPRAIVLAAAATAAALTVGAVAATGATGPAPSGRVAFWRSCGTGCVDIYTVGVNGRELRRLTRDSHSFDPAWSPDGGRIVFASDRRRRGFAELYIMRADGRTPVRITTSTAGSADERPAWSPAGDLIAFSRRLQHGNEEVYLVRPDGSGLRRLTSNSGKDPRDPAFSPDGTALAFTSERGPAPAVYVLDLKTRQTRRLELGASQPSWSCNGRQLAYLGETGTGIYIIDRDGTHQRRLRNTESSYWPAWSPDGRWLAFVRAPRTRAARSAIYRVRPDGTGLRRVLQSPSVDGRPMWQPAAQGHGRCRSG